jgi:hypothetical protein
VTPTSWGLRALRAIRSLVISAIPFYLAVLVPVATRAKWSDLLDDSTITIVDPWVVHVATCLPIALALAMLWAAAEGRPRWLPGGLMASLGFVGAVIGTAGALTIGRWGAWEIRDAQTGSDGRRYASFESRGIDGYEEMLGVEKSRSPWSRTFRTAPTMWLDHAATSSMARPATSKDAERRIYFTRDRIAAMVVHAACWGAFDASSGRFLSGTELTRLAPFALLDDSTDGLDADVETMVERVRRARGNSPAPSDGALTAALDHPNPWVRAAARRIVEAGGAEIYPAATNRLASATEKR